MSYCVDVISEDSFYENLVLGVTKLLESNQRVSNVLVDRRWPVDRVSLSSWEQRHSVSLPDDLKQFYLSTDGFQLKWSYQYSHDDILPVGLINVNTLSDLSLSPQLKELLDVASANPFNANEKLPQIGAKSKIFELDECKGAGKVCLIHSDNNWTIWFLENDGYWTWMADTFVYYFRMALVHQGLPKWQAVFSKRGLVPWAEQLFLLMAPHLLTEKGDKQSRFLGNTNSDAPLNHIDPAIFKIPVKHSTRGTNPK